MDTLEHAIKLITPGCYMASVDLKVAYYSVPIDKKYRNYFRFQWGNMLQEYTCYPQGWKEAPRKFTKVTKPLYSALRKAGHTLLGYIDDSMLQALSFKECEANIAATTSLVSSLGFFIHPIKSVLVPTQILTFLGFIINSMLMIVTLTKSKLRNTLKECSKVYKSKYITIRELARLVGILVSSFPGVELGKLHYRKLEK